MSETQADRLTEFYTQFQSKCQEISKALDLPSPNAETIAVSIASLRKSLVDVASTENLPSYDRQQYEQKMKTLEERLESLRSKSKPPSKFSFKRTPKATSTTVPKTIAPQHSEPKPLEIPSDPGASVVSFRDHAILTTASISSSSSSLTLSDLNCCVVDLRPSAESSEDSSLNLKAVHAQRLRSTLIILPIIAGSAILHGLKDCVIALSCQQFRIHESQNSAILLHTPSNPIIEHCSGLRFGHFTATENDRTKSKHASVLDFDQPVSSTEESVNLSWALLSGTEEVQYNLKIASCLYPPLTNAEDFLAFFRT